MKELTPVFLENSSFSARLPKLQIHWDSTSLGTLIECPRKYYYSIIWGFSPRDESVHLTFGILYHQSLEFYDHAKTRGLSHKQSMLMAVRFAMKATWNNKLNRPWSSDHKMKNRLTLIRTVIWYLIQFEDDPLQTIILPNGKPAVELSFRFRSDYCAPTGEQYHLCGHLDRVAAAGPDVWICDRKTSMYAIDENFFSKFTPDHQMSTYDFAGKVVYNLPTRGIIVDAAQVLVTLSRFERGLVPRTDGQRDEWYGETVRFNLEMAAKYAESGLWPRNEKACGHYGGCPFRSICGRDPSVREQWLRASYVQRLWDPLQVRGDI